MTISKQLHVPLITAADTVKMFNVCETVVNHTGRDFRKKNWAKLEKREITSKEI